MEKEKIIKDEAQPAAEPRSGQDVSVQGRVEDFYADAYVYGADAYAAAVKRFGRVRKILLSQSFSGVYIFGKNNRNELLKKLKDSGIEFVFKKATFGGGACIYVSASSCEKTINLIERYAQMISHNHVAGGERRYDRETQKDSGGV